MCTNAFLLLVQVLAVDSVGAIDELVAEVHIKMAEIATTAADQSDAQVQMAAFVDCSGVSTFDSLL